MSSTTGSSVTATPPSTITYTVTGTDATGCSATSTVTVIIGFPLPTDLSTANIAKHSALTNWAAVSCAAGYKVNYKQSSANEWTKKNIIDNTNHLKISGLTSGTIYRWKVATERSDGSYTKFSHTASFTTLAGRSASGDDEKDSKSNVSIFPNPTTGAFHIELNLNEDLTGAATITVLNAMGLVVSKQVSRVSNSFLEQQIVLDQTLPAGIYFINVYINDAFYSAKAFVQK